MAEDSEEEKWANLRGRTKSLCRLLLDGDSSKTTGRIAILPHVTGTGKETEDVAIGPVRGDLRRLRFRPGTNAEGIGTAVEGIAEVTGDAAEIATGNLRRQGKENGGPVNEEADGGAIGRVRILRRFLLPSSSPKRRRQ